MSRAKARELAKTFLERGDPKGALLVIARGRETEDDSGAMPWPLTSGDLELFTQSDLTLISFEDFFDQEDPPVRRFRAHYHKTI